MLFFVVSDPFVARGVPSNEIVYFSPAGLYRHMILPYRSIPVYFLVSPAYTSMANPCRFTVLWRNPHPLFQESSLVRGRKWWSDGIHIMPEDLHRTLSSSR